MRSGYALVECAFVLPSSVWRLLSWFLSFCIYHCCYNSILPTYPLLYACPFLPVYPSVLACSLEFAYKPLVPCLPAFRLAFLPLCVLLGRLLASLHAWLSVFCLSASSCLHVCLAVTKLVFTDLLSKISFSYKCQVLRRSWPEIVPQAVYSTATSKCLRQVAVEYIYSNHMILQSTAGLEHAESGHIRTVLTGTS